MWQLRTLPVVLTNPWLCEAVNAHVEFCAGLALSKVPIGHLRMSIELFERLLEPALEARLHASRLPSRPTDNRTGSAHANGITSSVNSEAGV